MGQPLSTAHGSVRARCYGGHLTRSLLLAALALTGCDSDRQVSVSFSPSASGQPVSCDDAASMISTLQFFVSDVELRDAGGRWQALTLNPTLAWQNDAVALVSYSCDTGTSQLTVQGRWPGEQIHGLRFTLGVPQRLNHQNPAGASSPLNVASMFWTWQQGYKFLRLEGSATTGGWAFHLGSTGCKSPAAIRPPVQPCSAANRVNVVLDNYGGSEPIIIDLDPLIQTLTQPGPLSCTDQYARSLGCTAALALLGLDAASGQCSSLPCQQRLFRAAGRHP